MSVKTTDVRTLSRNFKDYGDKEVTVAGWVRNMRDSKTFGFLVIADGTFFNTVQVVFNQDNIDNFDEVRRLTVGAAVYVTGIVTLTPEAKQPFEIQATKIEVEGKSTPDYPIQPK
ncbi:MAG: asparagine--tRNA ligase, partial [Pseudobutyrivibrio sp.]|nr:asparagine--tRNA ligase [Pseudobutyrivibrio sp.]